MAILLAVVVLSIFYAFRIPRLRRVTADQFPGVAPEIVAQWRTLELRSIYVLLLTTAGLLVIVIGLVALVLQVQFNIQDKNVQAALEQGNRLIMLIVFAGLIAAGNFGMQAGKLRKAYALDIPKKR